ncbi:MAG: type IX secretion system membrane protein PorP/SprF, partial [Crocinitomicaceae bacterium]
EEASVAQYQSDARSIIDQLLEKYTKLRKSKSISYGLYYRWNDAIIGTLGANLAGYKFGISFDATVSSLSNYNNSIGALEVYFKSQLNSKAQKRGKIRNLK